MDPDNQTNGYDPQQNPRPSDAENPINQRGETSKKKSKKLVIGLVVIALIITASLLWLFAIAEEETSPEQFTEELETISISITQDGFLPETMLITQGQTVTWVNESDEPHWIASNPYPTSDDFPELNSEEPINLGDSYTFTFEETGEFKYHDRLDPETNGTIIVEEAE